MLTIEDALEKILASARALPPVTLPLPSSVGCVLTEDVAADIDLPPFDKAIVDGYAVRSADFPTSGDSVQLRLGEWIAAGMNPTRSLSPGEAATIMTGAPIPPGSDAVVMHEQTVPLAQALVEFSRAVRPGQNIMTRGREVRAGEMVVPLGTRLSPAWLGVLASVGRTDVRVIARPRVAILPTGDELVEPGQPLGPAQIRNSNAIMLETLARGLGADAHTLPIAPDDPPRLRALLEQGLAADLLIITGGVSAGDRDFVPSALAGLGVEALFHKVRLKPGKPLWFGLGPERPGRPRTLVFGLPGNPVSGLVGFLLFIQPALAVLAGRGAVAAQPVRVRLARPFTHRGERATFYPARTAAPPQTHPAIVDQEPIPLAWIDTLDWAGSADLRTVASADGFAIFPPGDRDYHPGEIVGFHPLR